MAAARTTAAFAAAASVAGSCGGDGSDGDATAAATATATGPALRSARFALELEFVSLCADAAFVRSLAAQGLLAQAPFRRWLASLLTTWSAPHYAAHLLTAWNSLTRGFTPHSPGSASRLQHPLGEWPRLCRFGRRKTP